MADKPSGATVEQVATVCNLTPRRVQQLVKEGVMPRPERGAYNLALCTKAYIRHMQETTRGRPSTDEGLDRDKESARKLKAEADRVELEVAKVRNELVPITEFERVLAADHDETRAALTALPSKFARLVVDRTGCTMGVAQTLLADIADATLTEMQGEGDDEG